MKRLVLGLACLLACAQARSQPAATPEEQQWLEGVKAVIGTDWVERVHAAVLANDPSGCKYSGVDRRVFVEFVVAADGAIASERIRLSSEVPYIDRVALDSFRSVGHFPPPPAALAGKPLPFAMTLRARPSGPFRCQ